MKLCNIIFYIICFCLIFNNIPKILQMSFIGGGFGEKLSFYSLFIGFIYTIYYQHKYKNILINFDKFLKFMLVYLGVNFISLIIGLYNFPYYDLVINGPVTQIEKLPKIMAILDSFSINADQKVLMAFWMVARAVKSLLVEIIYTFGGVYMIYCWYYNNWKKGFDIFLKGILTSLIVVLGYGIIEIYYLGGSDTAKNILVIVNPYLHIINTDHGWWPPLLWEGQVRSVFAEPSFFSIWAAFALPFVWYEFFVEKRLISKYLLAIVLIIFNALIFLTNARTGIALFCGEFTCLLIYLLIIRKLLALKKFVVIAVCALGGFVFSNYFINTFINRTNIGIFNTKTIENYYENNLASISKVNVRSNGARYATIYANIMIGLDNPILGVGKNLVSAYMPDYFPDYVENNIEVQKWIKYQNEQGILKVPIPSFCAYSLVFSESGILGLFSYLLPTLLLIWRILKILNKNYFRFEYLFLLISLLGMLASGFSNTLNLTYCYWVLLGLGYAMCFGKETNSNLTINKSNE